MHASDEVDVVLNQSNTYNECSKAKPPKAKWEKKNLSNSEIHKLIKEVKTCLWDTFSMDYHKSEMDHLRNVKLFSERCCDDLCRRLTGVIASPHKLTRDELRSLWSMLNNGQTFAPFPRYHILGPWCFSLLIYSYTVRSVWCCLLMMPNASPK